MKNPKCADDDVARIYFEPGASDKCQFQQQPVKMLAL